MHACMLLLRMLLLQMLLLLLLPLLLQLRDRTCAGKMLAFKKWYRLGQIVWGPWEPFAPRYPKT